MPTGGAWSTAENVEVVRAYFSLLERELIGEKINKAATSRELSPLLDGRTKGSIDYKWRNISAILNEIRFASLSGYLAAANYQSELFSIVENYLESHPEVHQLAGERVSGFVAPPKDSPGVLDAWTDPPMPQHDRTKPARSPAFGRKPGQFTDYLDLEQRNIALGAAGELFVLRYEVARLAKEGAKRLAEKIIHVSKTVGDGEGYDIHSFDRDGEDRLIEVKTTNFGPSTPFYLSNAEATFSRENRDHYWIYRVFAYHSKPRLFGVCGDVAEQFQLSPANYIAKIRSGD